MESDVGLTPSNDGNVIRLQIPELTEERRRELVKVVHGVAEEGRVAVRNIRRDVMHDLRELKKEGEVGEDDERRAEAELQKHTDQAIEGDRRASEGQGRGDPRGLSEAGPERARFVAIITDGNGRWAAGRGLPPLEGHRAGADVVKAPFARRSRFGRRGAHRLLLLDRELVPAGRRGRGPDADVRRADRRRDRSSTPRACGCASSGAATGCRRTSSSEWNGPSAPRRQRPHHAVRGLQLRGPSRDPRRRPKVRGRGRRRVPAKPLCARDARPRPSDPNLRRAGRRRTSCCGSAPTPSWSFATSSGRTSQQGRVRAVPGRVRSAPASIRRAEDEEATRMALGVPGPSSFRALRVLGQHTSTPAPRTSASSFGAPLRAAAAGAKGQLDIDFAPLRAPGPRRTPRNARDASGRGETPPRIAWVVPWIVAIVAAIAVGGLLFAAVMAAFACFGLEELFRMGREARPSSSWPSPRPWPSSSPPTTAPIPDRDRRRGRVPGDVLGRLDA